MIALRRRGSCTGSVAPSLPVRSPPLAPAASDAAGNGRAQPAPPCPPAIAALRLFSPVIPKLHRIIGPRASACFEKPPRRFSNASTTEWEQCTAGRHLPLSGEMGRTKRSPNPRPCFAGRWGYRSIFASPVRSPDRHPPRPAEARHKRSDPIPLSVSFEHPRLASRAVCCADRRSASRNRRASSAPRQATAQDSGRNRGVASSSRRSLRYPVSSFWLAAPPSMRPGVRHHPAALGVRGNRRSDPT